MWKKYFKVQRYIFSFKNFFFCKDISRLQLTGALKVSLVRQLC